MDAKTLVGTVKGKVGMVAAHGQDVVKLGAQTLQAAKQVVDHSRRDALLLLNRTRDELTKTLKDGAAQVTHKLTHLATPTHKEAAEARKAQIKAKKRRKAKITPIHGARNGSGTEEAAAAG